MKIVFHWQNNRNTHCKMLFAIPWNIVSLIMLTSITKYSSKLKLKMYCKSANSSVIHSHDVDNILWHEGKMIINRQMFTVIPMKRKNLVDGNKHMVHGIYSLLFFKVVSLSYWHLMSQNFPASCQPKRGGGEEKCEIRNIFSAIIFKEIEIFKYQQ